MATPGTDGRVALVTGASGALGAAVARVLDHRGYRLALHYTNGEDQARKVAAKLSGPSTLVRADVADWAATRDMVDRVRAELGGISVLVNTGAIRRDGLMATQSVDDWTRTVAVNLIGTFHTCRAALPDMLRGRWGRIINVVSPAGLLGSRGQTAYSASKAGVLGMTRSLALECGRFNVTVNALSPGLMATALTEEVPAEVRATLVARTAFGRMGTPDEVARGIELLLDADYMTGQVLSIDGGMSIS
ncbi:3-oxoacyl-ACP reductase [Streptomyces avermitilis]|uniref:3-oxoacyl-ACP reductase n=2 Tax=Streptomyces avermitilis TaxID=33903 RepID=Q79ZE3_STRAW|nr:MULTISPECIES: 3-oxoacyl-ACP reductase family protein [Streptomyces]KUN50589.1 3-oxoacyl-ACP reductase [Streptomyces avermitilis]MYS97994.1 SDR family oxidoreductase [Streptomyces sp. SID5469]OOV24379.1 3-oxoacyl-ACP reductase [Streptomyces avermitilis]BAB69276.1 3-oxoacyl-(acyl carrier protein) reductase [Streptomyces avermitilis]BAC70098.1 putative 3-oxoacyl-ACP reductase [Streptomyces avermitilis MA-4680 = NBRC 14893]